jgi:hypothetical protein
MSGGAEQTGMAVSMAVSYIGLSGDCLKHSAPTLEQLTMSENFGCLRVGAIELVDVVVLRLTHIRVTSGKMFGAQTGTGDHTYLVEITVRYAIKITSSERLQGNRLPRLIKDESNLEMFVNREELNRWDAETVRLNSAQPSPELEKTASLCLRIVGEDRRRELSEIMKVAEGYVPAGWDTLLDWDLKEIVSTE